MNINKIISFRYHFSKIIMQLKILAFRHRFIYLGFLGLYEFFRILRTLYTYINYFMRHIFEFLSLLESVGPQNLAPNAAAAICPCKCYLRYQVVWQIYKYPFNGSPV